MFGDVPPINQSPEFLITFFSVLVTTTVLIIAVCAISYLAARRGRDKTRFAGTLVGAGLGVVIGGILGGIFFSLLGFVFDSWYNKSTNY